MSSSISTEKVLSKREEKLLDAIAESVSVIEASKKLRISPKTAYNILYRLRRRYQKARALVNKIEAQRRRSDTLRKVLTIRVKLEETTEEETEKEEESLLE